MYWHPYDIEFRHQLAREDAEKLEREMHSVRTPVQRRPELTERILLAFLPGLRRRRAAAATAAAAAEAAQRP
jgi:hypothetical protein